MLVTRLLLVNFGGRCSRALVGLLLLRLRLLLEFSRVTSSSSTRQAFLRPRMVTNYRLRTRLTTRAGAITSTLGPSSVFSVLLSHRHQLYHPLIIQFFLVRLHGILWIVFFLLIIIINTSLYNRIASLPHLSIEDGYFQCKFNRHL